MIVLAPLVDHLGTDAVDHGLLQCGLADAFVDPTAVSGLTYFFLLGRYRVLAREARDHVTLVPTGRIRGVARLVRFWSAFEVEAFGQAFYYGHSFHLSLM